MNVGRYLRGEDRHVGTARTTRPQPAQRTEPVIDKSAAIRIATVLGWTPQSPWVGLTDEDYVLVNQLCINPIQAAEFVDRLLKEKNA